MLDIVLAVEVAAGYNICNYQGSSESYLIKKFLVLKSG